MAERSIQTSGGGAYFPQGVGFTPVPNPVLASLLEEIGDLSQLKVLLRAIWTMHRKRGFPRTVSVAELCADRTVARMLGVAGAGLESSVGGILDALVKRGVLLGPDQAAGGYCLNTYENRKALGAPQAHVPSNESLAETWQNLEAAQPAAGAYACYEDNIGPLTPVVVARIQQSLEAHTEREVIAAVQAAVDANARSWNYIAAVLRNERSLEGVADGKPRRNPEEARSDEFIRKYVDRQRARGNR